MNLPIVDILTQIKALLSSEELMAEMYYCVSFCQACKGQIIRILYDISMMEGGVDTLIRNDLLPWIVNLLNSFTVDMVQNRQNSSHYGTPIFKL